MARVADGLTDSAMAKKSQQPKSPSEETRDRLRRWARERDFAQPIPWAEAEARIAADPVPPHDELETFFPPRTRSRVVPYLIVAPQALVTGGSSLVGLCLLAVHVFGDVDTPVFAEITRFVVLISIIVTVIPVMMSMSTKRRGAYQLLLSAGISLVSAVSFVILGTESQVGVWSSIRVMAAVAVAAGLVSYLLLRVFAKPGVSRTWREQWATPTLEEQWHQSQRGLVLQVLSKQGLVNSWDLPDLRALPIGAWSQLESQPDGHVVRHHR